ncbi:MAG: GNAT family protein [Legionellaceae bacterium]|nr:GNAT family protein [Legionellaceae bacterium]
MTITQFLDNTPDGQFHHDNLSFKLVTRKHRSYLAKAYADFATRHSVVPMMAFTPAGVDAKLGKFIALSDTGLGIFAVFDDHSKECIGFAGLSWMDAERTSVEYNRVLIPEFKNRGYGTRILQALKVLAFDHLGLDAFFGENLSYNHAAHKSQEDCGMEPFGTSSLEATIHGGNGNYKDTYCTVYRMTAEQYRSKPHIEKKSGISHPGSRSREEVAEQTYIQLKALSEKPKLTELEQKQWTNSVHRLFLFNYAKKLDKLNQTLCVVDPVQRLNDTISTLQHHCSPKS